MLMIILIFHLSYLLTMPVKSKRTHQTTQQNLIKCLKVQNRSVTKLIKRGS